MEETKQIEQVLFFWAKPSLDNISYQPEAF